MANHCLTIVTACKDTHYVGTATSGHLYPGSISLLKIILSTYKDANIWSAIHMSEADNLDFCLYSVIRNILRHIWRYSSSATYRTSAVVYQHTANCLPVIAYRP